MLASRCLPRPFILQNIESDVAVDHVDQTALIERDVVALGRGPARRGLRDEMADLAWDQRIGDVDDAQAAAEPDGIDDGARHALAELVGAEAGAARAAEGRIELAHLKLSERLDGAEVADIEGQKARMRAPAPRLLLALSAWSSSSIATAMRRPPMRPGTGITVCVGSGNSGWELYAPTAFGRARSGTSTTQKPACRQPAHTSSAKRRAWARRGRLPSQASRSPPSACCP